jgi:PAS domain S-box-containing protein
MKRPVHVPSEVILIVSDEPEWIGSALRDVGWTTECVATGGEALAWLADRTPALVMLDHALPDMTGLQLLHRAARPLPFIVTTDLSDAPGVAEMMKHGAHECVIKDDRFLDNLPFTVHRVLEHLDTKRRLARAEEAVARLAAEWQRTFDAMSEAVWILDEDHRILRSNKAAEVFFCRPFAEMVGKHCWEIMHGTTQPIPECPVRRARESLRHESQELSRGKSWLSVTVGPMVDASGAFGGAAHIVTDITPRRQAEAERLALQPQLLQAQKMESLSMIAGGVAHEINNPIMGIMSYAQLILEQPGIDGSAEEYAVEIGKEAERVALIVKNLLCFARADKETGRRPTRMSDIVDGTLSLTRTILRHDHIMLDVDVPADLPPINCHSQQIQQVIMNLLTNARDALNERYPQHHEDKRVFIRARVFERGAGNTDSRAGAEARSAGGEALPFVPVPDVALESPGSSRARQWMRLTIEDHGTGIPDDLQERIFDPFFTTKPCDKGTGMGLSISGGIVKDHGGDMCVESRPGQWTRFHVALPME